ncbi:hypothetical protein BC833DRAFT_548643 [Globomyces pollinis-pini]|nr:hypothetical protein BC833DRAFT_548643 [Globomyces pollinis-pini]
MSSSGLHGQKRFKTTEEARRIKEEREVSKIIEYQSLCDQLVQLRKSGNLSITAFDLTTKLLTKNPEFYTVWNYRREILTALNANSPDKTQERCESELAFSESLLKIVPKSYWVWNHRRYILELCPVPLWSKELKIVTYMLDLDVRNFHGWDYRRYVVNASKNVNPIDEFHYTTKKIKQNFSNYSAWHYRSKLLPISFEKAEIEKVMKDDLNLVRNAIFTEPKDQSAWLYQRYLFGRETCAIDINKAYLLLESSCVCVVFNQPVTNATGSEIEVNLKLNGEAVTVRLSKLKSSKVHYVYFDSVGSLPIHKLELKFNAGAFMGNTTDNLSQTVMIYSNDIPPDLSHQVLKFSQQSETEYTPSVIKQPAVVLEAEYESLQELEELEPDSKWVLLTLVHLQQALRKESEESIKLLKRLESIDPMRIGYYRDMASKIILNKALDEASNSDSNWHPLVGPSCSFTLSQQNLSNVHEWDRLCLVKTIDLSHNLLNSISLPILQVKELVLDNNVLVKIDGLKNLTNLTTLSVQNNLFSNLDSFQDVKSMKALKVIKLSGNKLSVSEMNEIISWLK